MGWFDKSDPVEKQLEMMNTLIEGKQNELERIEGVEGSPDIDKHREELQEQLTQLEMGVEDLKEKSNVEKEHYSQDFDILED